jgi:hypothetical protein
MTHIAQQRPVEISKGAIYYDGHGAREVRIVRLFLSGVFVKIHDVDPNSGAAFSKRINGFVALFVSSLLGSLINGDGYSLSAVSNWGTFDGVN